jgi:hypothetical protein
VAPRGGRACDDGCSSYPHSHRSSSWLRRIHSASTMASACSSAGHVGCASVITSFTSFLNAVPSRTLVRR